MLFPIERYGITVRLVEESDAAFILSLRTNENRNKHLSSVSNDLEKQILWIRNYKVREHQGLEYYFIVLYKDIAYGTTRIYKITDDSFETGSWIFAENTPTGVAVKGDIIGREFAFEILQKQRCTFEVRKQNEKVIQYHKAYKPIITGEDDLNMYFELSKENFYSHSKRLLKLFGYGN